MSSSLPSDPIHLPYKRLFGSPAPVVMVSLFHNHARTETRAYVDSGAWYSVFDADVAARLNIVLQNRAHIWSHGLDGRRVPVYLHRVGLELAGFHVSATVGFSDQMKMGFNLIGRHSIFNQLQFCFNDRDGEITITRLDS